MPAFNSLLQLLDYFKDENTCRDYLALQRWGDSPVCHHCGSLSPYQTNRGYKCSAKGCAKKFTVTTGTIFQGTKLPLRYWIAATYLSMHKKGISSSQLARDLNVTQKTAWFLLHRIRQMFLINESEQLEGVVQLDETFVGGKNKNRHLNKKVKNSQGRSFKDKVPVMGMLQEKTIIDGVVLKPSIVHCYVIPDTTATNIQPIIKRRIKEGSTLISDEWKAYNGLSSLYHHYVVDHGARQYVNDAGYTSNALEGFWSHTKRSIIGIYHRISPKHTEKYFNEFAFRYNNRHLSIEQQINTMLERMQNRMTYQTLIYGR